MRGFSPFNASQSEPACPDESQANGSDVMLHLAGLGPTGIGGAKRQQLYCWVWWWYLKTGCHNIHDTMASGRVSWDIHVVSSYLLQYRNNNVQYVGSSWATKMASLLLSRDPSQLAASLAMQWSNVFLTCPVKLLNQNWRLFNYNKLEVATIILIIYQSVYYFLINSFIIWSKKCQKTEKKFLFNQQSQS